MAKITFQDIKKNKNTHTIKKEHHTSIKAEPKPKMHFIDEDIAPIHKFDFEQRNNSKSKYTLWIIAIICIGALLFSLSFLFTKAAVTINPKIVDVVLDQTLSVSKDNKNTDLDFSLVSIEGEEKRIVEG
ncbi:MAG: hypothetical protein M3P22_02210, partial [bacterium]|nr:hypothetical protein [bacterium]